VTLEQVLVILPQQLVYGLALGAVYSLLAVGYTMVYGVLFMINFAHGDVLMVGSMIGWFVLAVVVGGNNVAPLLAVATAIIAAAALCGLLGVSIERVAYRPLYSRGSSRLGPLISALGVSLIIENTVLLFMGARPRIYPTSQVFAGVPGLEVGDVRVSSAALLIGAVGFATMVGLEYLVLRTRWGRGMRALRENPTAARFMGVDAGKVVSLTFLIGSALAGIAGVLIGLYYTQTDFLIGWYSGLKAFTAAVLGGIGNIRGAMLGGIVLGVVETLGTTALAATGPTTGFGTEYKDVITFLILIGVLILRPTGLLGARTREAA
jgi:branched-chain amino acid transport system permease protein